MKTTSILRSEKVSVEFAGFKAVNEVNFHLAACQLHFLIGPNGAGKTTFLDVLCGKVKAKRGKVWYKENVELTKKKEHQIADLGISRKFQAPSIFPKLTVYENLELAIQPRKGVWSSLFEKTNKDLQEKIQHHLQLIELQSRAEQMAGALSHGEKQWLEIGMMLVQEPNVLLLDEPVAGMTDVETEKTGKLLKEITKKQSVIVVEHDMEFVRTFSEKVTVMHQGALLMEGTMQEVQEDERVAEVYLGQRAS
ncbi:urea ABC transporter ATP-binding protein UrtD [Longirhabdus pacifica]|uniref:urea ABC transporter ATP-binding protein UrtD n=1 Tax=Longirhabdus pacifica TaxID=2305227 RepID=UPI001008A0FF|nr:urea ABC transporter ATP-binding protein UrtD [Longirhabdus pacifica]